MMPEIPPDLLAGLKQGVPGARDKVVDWLWNPLLRFVACRLSPQQRGESEGLVNMTLALAFKYQFYNQPAPVPYVFRILRSQLSKHFASSKRQASTSLDGYCHDDGDTGTRDVKDERANRPDARLDAEEFHQALRELAPSDQDLLWRLYVEDEKLREVAESLGMSIGGVTAQEVKAKRAFRRILVKRGFAESAASPLRSQELGLHPDDGQPITFVRPPGAARHYLLHNDQRRLVPRDKSRGDRPPTLEQAVGLLRTPVKERKRRQR